MTVTPGRADERPKRGSSLSGEEGRGVDGRLWQLTLALTGDWERIASAWLRGLRQRSRGSQGCWPQVGSTDEISPTAWHYHCLVSASRHLTNYPTNKHWASLVAQTVKNLPTMPETQVWSLGREDPLEKGMASHSSFLPGESHWL